MSEQNKSKYEKRELGERRKTIKYRCRGAYALTDGSTVVIDEWAALVRVQVWQFEYPSIKEDLGWQDVGWEIPVVCDDHQYLGSTPCRHCIELADDADVAAKHEYLGTTVQGDPFAMLSPKERKELLEGATKLAEPASFANTSSCLHCIEPAEPADTAKLPVAQLRPIGFFRNVLAWFRRKLYPRS